MKDILAADARGIVRAFARPDTLLGLDYDGTLAPIVDTPSAAGMRAETRVALARAAHALPTVVISGRARKDVAERVAGIPLRAVFGNHGMEGEGTDEADYRARTAAWHALLEPQFESLPGVWIEDKGVSLAVHTRAAPDPVAAERAVAAAVGALTGARVIGGARVFNVVPMGAPDKGTALLAMRQRLACGHAIYVGDDDNDEDVFRLAGHEPLLAVRVGASPRTTAPYFVHDQAHMDQFLGLLADLVRR